VRQAQAAPWQGAAASLFPGGVNSPVRAYRAVGVRPPAIDRGRGAHVWDESGRRYIDYVCAYGPLILGHAEPAVVHAVRSALERGGPFGVTGRAEVSLGELIRTRMPSVEKLRFVSSGTEAVMSAVRVARAATGRDVIVKFEGAYHGHSESMLVDAGSGMATLSMPASAGVPDSFASRTMVARYNDLDSVRALLGARPRDVAAIIVEPVAANMGVVAPRPGFLDGLRRLADEHGVILVFDEVITGFRVAPGGAQELYGVRPDLTVLGKVIGGGLPVGAYGGRAELMDLVAPSGAVYQAGTLSGHPAVMAAGEATLRCLTPDVYSSLEARSAVLEAGLKRIDGASVARVGSLLTVFFSEHLPRDFAEARRSDTAAFARFFRSMLAAGIVLGPSQYEAWFVSAAHGEEDIEATIRAATA
jgi:glutamate-1-semialdehyde 2,1-aminomutase